MAPSIRGKSECGSVYATARVRGCLDCRVSLDVTDAGDSVDAGDIMRALTLLVLLLAVLALFSFYEPLAPYWKNRFSAVMSCLDEGRYSDALAAAMEADVPGDDPEYWERSEPLGEVARGKKAAPVKAAAPEEEPAPIDTTEPAEEAVSDM